MIRSDHAREIYAKVLIAGCAGSGKRTFLARIFSYLTQGTSERSQPAASWDVLNVLSLRVATVGGYDVVAQLCSFDIDHYTAPEVVPRVAQGSDFLLRMVSSEPTQIVPQLAAWDQFATWTRDIPLSNATWCFTKRDLAHPMPEDAMTYLFARGESEVATLSLERLDTLVLLTESLLKSILTAMLGPQAVSPPPPRVPLRAPHASPR